MCRKLLFLISFVFLLGLVLPGVGNAVPYPTYYYKMNEVDGFIVGDSSGNEYDANLVPGDDDEVNGISWVADGNVAGCVLFSDSNDAYIEFDPNVGMKNTGGVVSMWIRLSSPQSTKGLDGYRFLFGTGLNGDKVQLYMNGNDKWLDMGLGDEHEQDMYIQSFQENTWYHVAVSWDCNAPVNADVNDGTYIVYIDGARKRGPSVYDGLRFFDNAAHIGNDADYYKKAFHGRIDEVAIWDTNLPVADVCDIYYHNFSEPAFNEATEPSPGRAEPRAQPGKILSWTAGKYAGDVNGHDVYFSTSFADVNQRLISPVTRDEPNWPPDVNLVLGETYYWAVDEANETKSEPNFWPGKVWKFTVDDGKAWKPNPEDDDDPDEDDQVTQDVTLKWRPGSFANATQGHDVYIGTNKNDVNIATTATAGIYKGRQDSNDYTCSDSNLLTLGEVYYLRVDEVNATWEPSVVKGDIWAFRAFIGYHLDDFETYTSDAELRAVWTNRYNATSPYWETGGVGHGSQSAIRMRFKAAVDGGSAPWYAEVGMHPMQDITFGGIVKALSLWYRCDDPYTNEIYVVVKDNNGKEARVTPSDPNDPNTDEEWHHWNIDFEDFNQPAPNDVNLADVNMLYLGVGDGTTAYTDTGYIFFDDIDLYLARCLYDTLHPVGDVDHDCVINWEDIEQMNDDWLESDYSSLGYDGELHGFTGINSGWTADGNCIGGRGLKLTGGYNPPDDSNDWVDIDDYALPNFQDKTISLWVKSGGLQDRWPDCGVIFGTNSEYTIQIAIDGGYKRIWYPHALRARLGYECEDGEDVTINYALITAKKLDNWSHVAFVLHNVYNPSMPTWEGDPCTVRAYLYHNGQLAESADTPNRGRIAGIARHTANHLEGANIGSTGDGETRFVDATVDDFRIYDYNMTQTDVCDLWERDDGDNPGDANIIVWFKFDETSGMIADDFGKDKDLNIYHELYSNANVVEKPAPKAPYDPANPDIVNLVDYALVADNWLDKQYWPTW